MTATPTSSLRRSLARSPAELYSRRTVAGVLLVAVLSVLACSSPEPATPDEAPPPSTIEADDMGEGPIGGEYRGAKPAVTVHTDLGTFDIELWPHVAPKHVARFLALAEDGTYTGTRFHRVVSGFLIQGGDPNSKDDDPSNDGYGTVDPPLAPEFSSQPFARGTVGMARDHRPASASCQFFVVLNRSTHLDGQYTAFGEVVSGMSTVDAIAAVPADARRRPLEPPRLRVEVTSP
jgi:peptidyl-prolyl cis-trans isomerase B (cyclophilin B)